MNSISSNLLYMRNLQEKVKKTFCYQKLFWPFTVWINCSSDLKTFANSWPSALNFKRFSQSLEQFFLTVGQNNFGNKLPFFLYSSIHFFVQSLSALLPKIYSLFFKETVYQDWDFFTCQSHVHLTSAKEISFPHFWY